MFMITKSTSNVSDDATITIKDAELPSTITVWGPRTQDGVTVMQAQVAITFDVNSTQVWGPDGEEIAHWFRNPPSVAW